MISTLADFIVAVVRYGYRRKAWLSAAALVGVFVIASGYLLIGALRVSPLAANYRVTVQLPESAGLLPNQAVTLRGVSVGRVERLDITQAGVDAIRTAHARIAYQPVSDYELGQPGFGLSAANVTQGAR